MIEQQAPAVGADAGCGFGLGADGRPLPLVSLHELLQRFAKGAGLPPTAAGVELRQRIESGPAALFLVDPAAQDYAHTVGELLSWPGLPADGATMGRAAALRAFAVCTWPSSTDAAATLRPFALRLAVTQHDAQRLFPEAWPARSFWDRLPSTVAQVAPGRELQALPLADAAPTYEAPKAEVRHLVPVPAKAAASPRQGPDKPEHAPAPPLVESISPECWPQLIGALADEERTRKHGAQGRLLKRWPELFPGVRKPSHQSLSKSIQRARDKGIKPPRKPGASVWDLAQATASRPKR